METSFDFGSCLIGGAIDFPCFAYLDVPVAPSAIKTQINLMGGDGTLVPLTGSVYTQITGNFVDGINRNFPGVLANQ